MKCSGRDDCLPESEIIQFFKNKYLLLLHNGIRFDASQYDTKSVIPESRIIWLTVNTQVRQTIPYRIARTSLELQDAEIDLDQLTVIEDSSPFKLERHPTDSYEFEDAVMFNISIEMEFDQKVIERTVYNYLDLLSDIGGIQSILVQIVAGVLLIWNFNDLDNYIVTNLFKV